MNGMNDQRFHDLAMKVLASQGSETERAELDSLMADHPELKPEFERLRGDVRVTRELLLVAAATEVGAGEFPAYARERLKTKVRQTLGGGRPRAKEDEAHRGWLWLGLAAAAVAIVTLTIPLLLLPTTPVIQVAMLDLAGQTRGSNTNEIAILQAEWKDNPVQTFSVVDELERWEKKWPTAGQRPVFKVIYDRAAAELRVAGKSGSEIVEKTFPGEVSMDEAVKRAKAFIAEQTRR